MNQLANLGQALLIRVHDIPRRTLGAEYERMIGASHAGDQGAKQELVMSTFSCVGAYVTIVMQGTMYVFKDERVKSAVEYAVAEILKDEAQIDPTFTLSYIPRMFEEPKCYGVMENANSKFYKYMQSDPSAQNTLNELADMLEAGEPLLD